LDKKLKKNLIKFDEEKFAVINNEILNDNGVGSLKNKIEEASDFIKNITKRNKKFLAKMM
jgi:hypothetical protein